MRSTICVGPGSSSLGLNSAALVEYLARLRQRWKAMLRAHPLFNNKTTRFGCGNGWRKSVSICVFGERLTQGSRGWEKSTIVCVGGDWRRGRPSDYGGSRYWNLDGDVTCQALFFCASQGFCCSGARHLVAVVFGTIVAVHKKSL